MTRASKTAMAIMSVASLIFRVGMPPLPRGGLLRAVDVRTFGDAWRPVPVPSLPEATARGDCVGSPRVVECV